MKAFFFAIFSIALVIGSVQSQTLLTETTWGGAGRHSAARMHDVAGRQDLTGRLLWWAPSKRSAVVARILPR
jgi:hypothetical protein